jgi:hypothetical protein
MLSQSGREPQRFPDSIEPFDREEAHTHRPARGRYDLVLDYGPILKSRFTSGSEEVIEETIGEKLIASHSWGFVLRLVAIPKDAER